MTIEGSNARLDRHISELADAHLRQYTRATLREFVRDDGQGAKHSLEQDIKPSAINTAAFCRVVSRYPSLCPGLDTRAWIDTIIIPEIERLIPEVAAADPRSAEYAVYRIAQLLLATSHAPAEAGLRQWLGAYLNDWFSRRSAQPSVFLVYLAASALRDPQDVQERVQRFAEVTVQRQLSLIAGQTASSIDAIDLGLALSLVRVVPHLAQIAYDVLNKASGTSGVWSNRQALVRLGERAVGCSAFEACVALLRGSGAAFRAMRPAFVAHLTWLRDEGEHQPWKFSDIYSREAVHETWFNCLAAEFVYRLREHAETSLQMELRARLRARSIEQTLSWKDLVIEERAKAAIAERMIVPARRLLNTGRLEYSTAILFGPPGTAKTTIAEVAAAEVGWPFVSLGVADFLRDSLDRVFATSLELFADLYQLDRCVVLLDEVESVFAERGGQADLRQKFLTSALLPPLKNVRERGRVLLFIATNYVHEFDAAIRRQGRIDLIVPIGPPDRDGREALLQKAVGLEPHTSRVLAGLMREGTTIAEVLAVKRLRAALKPGNPLADAQLLYDVWKERFRKAELGDDVLDTFRKDRDEYARYE